MEFKEIGSTPIYHGRVFDVRQDQVSLPSGRIVQLDIVTHPGAVVLVPVDAQGYLWFVRQYRHAVGKDMLELPAGTLEAGEDIKACLRPRLLPRLLRKQGRPQATCLAWGSNLASNLANAS